MPNRWIIHVQSYAKHHGVSYKQALKDAKSSYKTGAGNPRAAISRAELTKANFKPSDARIAEEALERARERTERELERASKLRHLGEYTEGANFKNKLNPTYALAPSKNKTKS